MGLGKAKVPAGVMLATKGNSVMTARLDILKWNTVRLALSAKVGKYKTWDFELIGLCTCCHWSSVWDEKIKKWEVKIGVYTAHTPLSLFNHDAKHQEYKDVSFTFLCFVCQILVFSSGCLHLSPQSATSLAKAVVQQKDQKAAHTVKKAGPNLRRRAALVGNLHLFSADITVVLKLHASHCNRLQYVYSILHLQQTTWKFCPLPVLMVRHGMFGQVYYGAPGDTLKDCKDLLVLLWLSVYIAPVSLCIAPVSVYIAPVSLCIAPVYTPVHCPYVLSRDHGPSVLSRLFIVPVYCLVHCPRVLSSPLPQCIVQTCHSQCNVQRPLLLCAAPVCGIYIWPYDVADINECEAEEPPCDEDQYCTNNEGSYSCTGLSSYCNTAQALSLETHCNSFTF